MGYITRLIDNKFLRNCCIYTKFWVDNICERVIVIRVTVNDSLKVVQFWCDKADCADDKKLFDKVQTLYTAYAPNEKYRKVIYRTGNCDLLNLTSDLLRHNVRQEAAA